MSENTIRLPKPSEQSMDQLCSDIESCGYRCEAGALDLNVAWLEIKRRAARAYQDQQAVVLATLLFDKAMQFYAGQITYPEMVQGLLDIVNLEELQK